MTVIDQDHGYARVMRELADLGGDPPAVYVGIREQDGAETIEGGEITLAGIAAVHEFGTDRAGRNNTTVIPSRSFLRAEVDQNEGKYATAMSKAIGKTIDGQGSIERNLGRVGVECAGNVRRRIRARIPPPLAESTIAGRKHGGDVPLIDQGRIIQSISSEVKR